MNNIIVGEGKNDRAFLHETITNKLDIDQTRVKAYSEYTLFYRDIRTDRQKHISIIEGGGSNCPKVVIKYCRQFWYKGSHSIGVVADLDRGPIYDKLVDYLRNRMNTECWKHNVNPQVDYADSEKKLTLSFRRGRTFIIWTWDIPESLELKISRALKRKYPSLRLVNNEDKIIAAAADKLSCTKEEIFKGSVNWVQNEKWFTDLCLKLRENLQSSSQYCSPRN